MDFIVIASFARLIGPSCQRPLVFASDGATIQRYCEFTIKKFTRTRPVRRKIRDGDVPATRPDRHESAPGSDHTDVAVGRRIRHLRKARGRSLKEVALRAGLSESFLSQIERGISSASIRALARVADALDVGIAELFPLLNEGEPARPVTIAHREDRKRIEMPQTRMSKELLTPFATSPRLDIYIITIEPGGSTGEVPFVHQGEEAGFVLEGGIELIVDGEKSILAEGDSFRFSSTLPHRYRNAGTRRARAVWINYRDP